MPFRIQYKTVGLTYSQCPLERKVLMDKLLGLHNIGDYYVARETHKDGNFHLHVWFEFLTKPNIKNCKAFDIDGYHPNVGKKKRNWIWNYLKKQDKEPYTNIPDGFVELARQGKIKEATDSFIAQYPKDYVINKERIDFNIRMLGKRKREDPVYDFKTFKDIKVPDWEGKTLYIEGAAGTGKTEWAKSYVVNVLKTDYLRCTHIDCLKRYNGEGVILWDDVSFKHLPRETVIHIVETRNARDIHCRHKVAHIPPGVKNIILHNSDDIFPRDRFGAIDRRIVHWAPLIRFY